MKEGCKTGKIISIMNRKGGVSKTTTVQALGQGLELRKYKILFVDLDPQSNLGYVLGYGESDKNIYNVLVNDKDPKEQIIDNILCASPMLSNADFELMGKGKEYKLKKALDPLKKSFDYIILDTPPSLNILTINALVASDEIIIVSNPDILTIQGILQLKDTIDLVKNNSNKDLKINGILLTKFNLRAILNRDLLKAFKDLAADLSTEVYKTHIRDSVAIKEAQVMRENLYSYAPKNGAITDYKEFVKEFIQKQKRQEVQYG